MDTLSLAPQALELLQLVGAGVVGGALQSMGEDAHQKAKALMQTLRSRWSDNDEALAALETYQPPSSVAVPVNVLNPERKALLLALLTQALREDEALRTQVEGLVSSSPQLRVAQTVEQGRNLTGVEAEEFASGQVEVTQQVQRADDVTGAKIGRIG